MLTELFLIYHENTLFKIIIIDDIIGQN